MLALLDLSPKSEWLALLKYTISNLREDLDFILNIVKKGGGVFLQFADESLRDNLRLYIQLSRRMGVR
jgi:hypothetical protein